MGDGPSPTDGRRAPPTGGRAFAGADRPRTVPELRLVVVERDGKPDRGTIHPPGLAGIERMETWLSADTSAFVALAAWR